MRRLPTPGPRIIAAIGCGLCFLIASFLCGFTSSCDGDPKNCSVALYAPGTYTIIWKRHTDGSFAHMNVDSTGGVSDPFAVDGKQLFTPDATRIDDCDKVESIHVLHALDVLGQAEPPEKSIGRNASVGSGK